MIAMIVVGCVLIPVYALWDLKYAKFPVIARRFVFNRSVVLACAIGAFDFVRIFSISSGTTKHPLMKFYRSPSTSLTPTCTPLLSL